MVNVFNDIASLLCSYTNPSLVAVQNGGYTHSNEEAVLNINTKIISIKPKICKDIKLTTISLFLTFLLLFSPNRTK